MLRVNRSRMHHLSEYPYVYGTEGYHLFTAGVPLTDIRELHNCERPAIRWVNVLTVSAGNI